MQHPGLKITENGAAAGSDQDAMSRALSRLYGAASQSVHAIVADLSQSERARLAVFCYGRAHLNAIGLAIAATCDLDHLMAASHSSTAGRMLFAQSRDVPAPEKVHSGRRSSITLASSAGAPRLPEFPADLPG